MQKMGKFLLLLSNVLHKCGTEYWDRTRKGAEGSIKGLFNLLWGLKLTYVSLFCIIILNPPLICLSLSLAQLEFVQIDPGHRHGHDGDGGGHHVFVEPLQTLSSVSAHETHDGEETTPATRQRKTHHIRRI